MFVFYMLRRFRKYIEYLGAFLLILMLISAIGGVIIVRFYGNDVKQYAIEELNNRMDTKISVGNLDVTFFQKFPYITIVLEQATIWSGRNFARYDFPSGNTDTLFHAEAIYLRFNPLSMLNKHYKIGKMQAVNGFLNVYTDLSGHDNYHLQKHNDNRDGSPLFLDLKKVELENFSFKYLSLPDKVDLEGTLETLTLSGKFSSKKYDLLSQARITVDHFRSGNTNYLQDQHIKTRLGIAVSDSLYNITAGSVIIDNIALNATGSFVLHTNGSVSLDLVQTAENIDLEKVLELIPPTFLSDYNNISIRGSMSLNSTVKGNVSAGILPVIDADFNLKKGFIRFPGAPYPVEQMSLDGHLKNNPKSPGELSLSVENFRLLSGGDELNGSLNFVTGRQKQFYGNIKGRVETANLPAWYPPLPIKKCSGTVDLGLDFSGVIDKGKGSGGEIFLKGNLGFDDLKILFPWYDFTFEDLKGTLGIDGSDMTVDLDGKAGDSDFHFNGELANLSAYLRSDNEYLLIDGKLFGRNFHVDELIDAYHSVDQKDGTEAEDSVVHLPSRLIAKIYFEAENLFYENVSATTASGSASYAGKVLSAEHFTMNTMDGRISGKAALGQLSDNSFRFDLSAGFDRIDIEKMFLSFNNFGQDFITNKHLKGSISGSGVLSLPLTSGFSSQPEHLKCESSLVINNGELVGFEPLSALSAFIDVDELSDIRFSKLENNILISEGRVYIPEMTVQNSAINLTAAGEHSFDNLYDYRIRLKLSDLLYNKAKKDKDLGIETASDEGDQRTLFLKIYDHGPGMKVEYDRKQAAEKIRSDLKEEKQELKVLFNEEFGMFKNNEAVKQNAAREVKEEPLFRFEFQDENTNDSIQNKKPAKRDKKRNKTTETKPDFEIVIDDK